MVLVVIFLLLMLILAMFIVFGVVREKELGSIINFYVILVICLEFLLGKQLSYVVLGMINFFLLVMFAVFVFGVPVKGSMFILTLGALLYIVCVIGLGLLMSSVLNSQIAAIFGTAIAILILAVQFSGLIHPVSAMEGAGVLIGQIYPISYFLIISRGVFSKSLGLEELYFYLIFLLLTRTSQRRNWSSMNLANWWMLRGSATSRT